MPSRRWLSFGAAALSIHVALAVSLGRLGARDEVSSTAPTTEIEFDRVDTVVQAAAEPEPAAAGPASAPAGEARPLEAHTPASARAIRADRREARADSTTGPSGAAGEAAGDAPETAGDAPEAADPGAGPAWTFDPRQDTRMVTAAIVAGAARKTAREAPDAHPPSGLQLAEMLDAKDVARGIGRGGPLLSALEKAASSSDAPYEGAATFDVGVDSEGHVSVALLDDTPEAKRWSGVAAAARAAVDPTHVRIPPGARGWHVVARIEAKVQYPNGLSPASVGVHADATAGRIAEDGRRIAIERVPGISVTARGKVCSVRIALDLSGTPISGGCDPANIGANPVRLVHGRVIEEGRF